MMSPSDNFLMRNATAIAITAVTVLMLGAALTYLRQETANDVTRGWVTHSYEVRGHVQALLAKLEEAQIGQRGFLLTGRPEYLEPYNDALKPASNRRARSDDLRQHHSIKEELEILRRLTADNLTQQQYLDDADEATDDFLKFLADAIQWRRGSDGRNLLENVDLERGKLLLDRLRSSIRLMTAEEEHLLTLRIQADSAARSTNRNSVLYGILIAYLMLVFSILAYQRARQRNEKNLLHYTQQLERNEEELKLQQEELKASNEEIEASNEELEEQNAQIRLQSEELERNKQLIEEKAREVEQASKYKSEFLANMSHELRTPLNSLLILARSLASNEDGNLTDSQIEEAQIIHNDGLELLNLINDILDLSKVEAGKLSVIPSDVALDTIVHQLQQQFEPIAREKKVAFPIQVEADLPASLHTDVQRVEQIVKNLLSNAFKFTHAGSVTLKVHRAAPDLELQRATLQPGQALVFSVIDTGIGIDASKLNDIFEAFQQEDGATDRHYGGTGLGLTIARKFAHLLGGEVHVSSQKGQGSTFSLVLPTRLDSFPLETAPSPASASAPANSLAVRTALKEMPRSALREFIPDDRHSLGPDDKVLLIIEDDPGFATTLMKIGRKRGYRCLAAGSGKSGLLLAMEQPVTAILLDLKLPDIDGLQVLDLLKHDLRSRHIPVHVISGRQGGSDAAALRRGAVGYLAKPAPQEGIDGALAKIEALLQAEMKQILLIDDDTHNQVAVQSLLKQRDIRITPVGTGSAGLEQLRATDFDCVILDLRLPDMSGFDWLERAEQALAGQELPPVIVYTAKELTPEENRNLNRYTGSIIIKGAQSPERLLDEVTLFLHSLESKLSKDQREMIRMQHDPDRVLQGRTILLADDDLRNTFALSKLLKKHGMKVVIADNGQMAMDKLHEDASIDLLILDIMMPILDGYQTLAALRADPSLQTLPVIALTARAMPEEQEKCMAAGANDYMTKPVDVERLLTLLRVWLFKQELAA